MRADSNILREEAREKLKEAMASYPGDAHHVAIYALDLVMQWNDLQELLAEEDEVTSDPQRVRTVTGTVDEYLSDRLRDYLDIS